VQSEPWNPVSEQGRGDGGETNDLPSQAEPSETPLARPKVLVTRALPEDLIEPLAAVADVDVFQEADVPMDRQVLLNRVAGVSGIVSMLTEKLDEAVFQAAGPTLRVVANMAVGYDNIDTTAAKRYGITVTNTPDVLTETTADLAFGLLLATARRIPEAQDFLLSGQWQTWSPMLLTGVDVYGKTIGIVGLGRIGQAVARRAAGFGMNILYHNRHRNLYAEQALTCHYVSLDDLLTEADFVLSMVPGSAESAALFNARAFSLMKPSAIFVNTSRGTVVDEDALVTALTTGQIRAAGLDVFRQEPIALDHPLLGLKNVVLVPHIGSASVETRRHMAELALQNCLRVITGKPPLTPVT
jgi:glyoxylate reductase